MKHHALVLLSLLFLAVPTTASAGTVTTDSENPAAEVPAACSDGAGLPEAVRVGFGSLSVCTATAQCDPFTDVGCQGNSNCSVADRNCSVGQRGFVTCDGSTTYCAGACCAQDGVCEYSYGCGCSDKDCCDLPACSGHPNCVICECSEVTDCTSNRDCCNPGSICTPSGICLCAG